MTSQYRWWKGEALSSPFAFDTETRLIEKGLDVPELALMVASDGVNHVVIHPGDVLAFTKRHSKHNWYGFNVVFDFWVLDQHLNGDRTLWDITDSNRLTCLRLLWRLVRLAEWGVPNREGTLADCCVAYGVEPVPDKADPYRLRYGELIGLPISEIDSHPESQGFVGYAVNDAVATYGLIKPLTEQAVAHMKRCGFGERKNYAIRPDALRKWGPLSVNLQTKADIVVAQLSRERLHIDKERLSALEGKTRQRLDELVTLLEEACPGIWDRYKKTGELKRNAKTHLPRQKKAPLVALLRSIAAKHKRPVLYSKGKQAGKVSTSSKDWARNVTDPFVKLWNEFELLKKLLGTTLIPMREGVVHAQYEVLLKTGRTSASKHKELPSIPIQQIPRSNEIRSLFMADDDCLRMTCDYSYLELRTLAATCLGRFGHSKLAEAVRLHTESVKQGRKGIPDPHEWMAATSLGLPPGEVLQLAKAEQKAHRQRAKVANFGFPGGLGVQRTIEYAEVSYGVKLTREEAKALKQQWLDAFPEMTEYLADNTTENLANGLRCPAKLLTQKFGRRIWFVREAIQGFLEEERARWVVETLLNLSNNPELTAFLTAFDYSSEQHEELTIRLLTGPSATLTGLVRGKTGYSDGANLPFQGLAAAGAKEALWRLLYAGYRVKAFVHDEILVDLPKAQADRLKPRIHKIMDEAMEDVMGHGVPSMSESHLGPTWTKG